MSDRLPPSDAAHRLVSYNVRYAGLDDGDRSWASRRSRVVDAIETADPDMIALQELWRGQQADIEDALDGYGWVAREADPTHTAVAYRLDRYRLVGSTSCWLSPPETVPGVPGWDATYPRLATCMELRDRYTGARIVVYSVHLDHEGDRARRESVDLLRQRLADEHPDVPAMLAGDYNCGPGDAAYERALDDDAPGRVLRDARHRAEQVEGPEETYVGFENAPASGGSPDRIDHVLVTAAVDVDRFATLVSDGPPASDHRPIVADVQIP